jgi:hypothetical protein
MELTFTPLVVACCFVIVAYLVKGRDEDVSKRPSYFVVFSIGLVLACGVQFFFGNSADETINNVMKEIDVGAPDF